MKTIVLGMLFALSCNYCFAQLKIENSTQNQRKKMFMMYLKTFIYENHIEGGLMILRL